MNAKERIKQDVLKIIECTSSVDEHELPFAVQMNVDHYFDRRLPPYNGELFNNVQCFWIKGGTNGPNPTTEEK